MLVLRAHLFAENLLERIIQLRLPRGDKVIESASFTFAQKLVLVDALQAISDAVSSSLRNLNKLRNQCAHDLSKKIADADVTRVGSPLGKEFSEIRRDHGYQSIDVLRGVIGFVCGYLTAECTIAENTHIQESKK